MLANSVWLRRWAPQYVPQLNQWEERTKFDLSASVLSVSISPASTSGIPALCNYIAVCWSSVGCQISMVSPFHGKSVQHPHLWLELISPMPSIQSPFSGAKRRVALQVEANDAQCDCADARECAWASIKSSFADKLIPHLLGHDPVYVFQWALHWCTSGFIQFTFFRLSYRFLQNRTDNQNLINTALHPVGIRQSLQLTRIIFWSRINFLMQLKKNTDVIVPSNPLNTIMMNNNSLFVSLGFFSWNRKQNNLHKSRWKTQNICCDGYLIAVLLVLLKFTVVFIVAFKGCRYTRIVLTIELISIALVSLRPIRRIVNGELGVGCVPISKEPDVQHVWFRFVRLSDDRTEMFRPLRSGLGNEIEKSENYNWCMLRFPANNYQTKPQKTNTCPSQHSNSPENPVRRHTDYFGAKSENNCMQHIEPKTYGVDTFVSFP